MTTDDAADDATAAANSTGMRSIIPTGGGGDKGDDDKKVPRMDSFISGMTNSVITAPPVLEENVTLDASLDVIPQPSLDCVRIRSMEHLGSLPLKHRLLRVYSLPIYR